MKKLMGFAAIGMYLGQSALILPSDYQTLKTNRVYYGSDNLIDGKNNQVGGYLNNIKGNTNLVKGDVNTLDGHLNSIRGDGNLVSGDGNIVVSKENNNSFGDNQGLGFAREQGLTKNINTVSSSYSSQSQSSRNEPSNTLYYDSAPSRIQKDQSSFSQSNTLHNSYQSSSLDRSINSINNYGLSRESIRNDNSLNLETNYIGSVRPEEKVQSIRNKIDNYEPDYNSLGVNDLSYNKKIVSGSSSSSFYSPGLSSAPGLSSGYRSANSNLLHNSDTLYSSNNDRYVTTNVVYKREPKVSTTVYSTGKVIY